MTYLEGLDSHLWPQKVLAKHCARDNYSLKWLSSQPLHLKNTSSAYLIRLTSIYIPVIYIQMPPLRPIYGNRQLSLNIPIFEDWVSTNTRER